MSPGRLVDIVINTVTMSMIFQSSHLSSVNQIISWHSASMNDIIHYENDSYYLLTIDYNETGPLEIAVTFSNDVSSKTTVIQYNSKSLVYIVIIKYVYIIIIRSILISVELNSTSFLIIESRDCIASPENYSIVVTINDTDTKLLNVTFNSNIQYDVGDQLMPNIQYIIRTVIIEMTSSTVIDENITIIMYSTSTDPTGYSLYMHVCLCLK